jgi:adenylosuccinate synthase
MSKHPVHVVIGAQWGDEGKGLLTDFYAAQAVERAGMALVVRFNGGAQAGHTVQTPTGERHVFKHVGSGAFVGGTTLLAREFLVNPMVFFRERAMASFPDGPPPQVIVDPRCRVTTAYDMLLNQAAELQRGLQRHGSVGLGINETVERSLRDEFRITAADLGNAPLLRDTLTRIRDEWLPMRAEELGLRDNPLLIAGNVNANNLFENWLADAARFRAETRVEVDAKAVRLFADRTGVVFEGAQGLQLDQERGAFPHVTRSCTGMTYVCPILDEAGITDVDVTYVTRAYSTRHGAGPLPHELPDKPYPGVVDPTNFENRYQGALRFAYLDVTKLTDAVSLDFIETPDRLEVRHHIAVTCLDQLPEDGAKWWTYGQLDTGTPEDLLDAIETHLVPNDVLVSAGPTRDHVAVRNRVTR